MLPSRTWLFAPGNHPRRASKAFEFGADAAILDLEDAVAVAEKPSARALVANAVQQPRSSRSRAYVRVNALDTPFAFEDLETVVVPGLDGIVLPKVERPSDIRTADWVIGNLERRHGLETGSIDLVPIIETGKGVANAREICGVVGRVRRVSFGAADYTADMAMEWTLGEREIETARAEIVLASRIGGLEPPIDTVFTGIRDTEGFLASCTRVRRAGFQGKLCIHPDQVEPANRSFTPSDDAVAQARKIVAAFRDAEAAGSASIQVDGGFVDYPVVLRAERIVALAEALNRGEG